MYMIHLYEDCCLRPSKGYRFVVTNLRASREAVALKKLEKLIFIRVIHGGLVSKHFQSTYISLASKIWMVLSKRALEKHESFI